MVMRPAGWPPIETSKKTVGFGMVRRKIGASGPPLQGFSGAPEPARDRPCQQPRMWHAFDAGGAATALHMKGKTMETPTVGTPKAVIGRPAPDFLMPSTKNVET